MRIVIEAKDNWAIVRSIKERKIPFSLIARFRQVAEEDMLRSFSEQ